MFKRAVWTGVGYSLGLGSSIYVQRRIRRTVDRYAPQEVRRTVSDAGNKMAKRAKVLGSEVFSAAQEGRRAMKDEEIQLRHEFGLTKPRYDARYRPRTR